MAQGRPPRHSKSKRDPVTIDLEAEKAADEAESKLPEKAGEPSETPKTDTTAVAGVDAADTPVVGETPSGEAERPAHEARKPAAESTAAAEAAASSDTFADAAAAEASPAAGGRASGTDGKPDDEQRDASGKTPPEAAFRRPAPADRNPRTGRAFAAGLLGGAAVLVVFYALQAGGVVPVPGTDDQAATRNASTLAALGSEVNALKQSVAELNSGQANAGGDAAVADLEKQVADLSKSIDAIRAGNEAGAGTNAADVSALAQTVGALQDSTKQTGSDVSALADRVAKIEAQLSKPSDETRIARSIAAAGLRSAIDRGGPFDAELQAYRSVAPDDPAIDKLTPVAAGGVPSQRQLVSAFPNVADAILAAVAPQGADSGVFDRLVASARSLVKVRPTGNVEGNTPAAIVARMDVKLKDGDLKGVVAEWNALPEAGKKASQPFIDDVNARLAAEAAVDDILRGTNRTAGNATEGGQAQ